jgi:trimeric autotransporter adhesin
MRSPILFVGVIVLVCFAVPVKAQFADDNVKSDTSGNTAVGADALFTLSPANESSLECGLYANQCTSNTALGNNALYSNTSGASNVAAGAGALYLNMMGSYNVAIGVNALYNNANDYNTAVGHLALAVNTSGSGNTAVGESALSSNQTGSANTAVGLSALEITTGSLNTALGVLALAYAGNVSDNTAVGYEAMQGQTYVTPSTGSYNTAIGSYALYSFTSGAYNTVSGYEALYSNTTADYNTASGFQALYKSNAVSNTASGYQALYADTSGAYNTAMGVHALQDNSSGSSNIGIGYHGGINLTTGSNNIDIGSPGVAADSDVIRIGTITGTTSTQKATYIAGIYGKTSGGGLPVVIDSNGLLGTTTSSARFKTEIEPMGSSTEKLGQLRPVKFEYKADPQATQRYGLIAEEVATVYPELVVRDANGRIDGVRYDELAPMLLNEMQKQQKMAHAQAKLVATQSAEIGELKQQLAVLRAALVKLQTHDALFAQR